MKIYVVDDEHMAIKYFQYLLDNIHFDCEMIGHSTNSLTALSEILRLKPDVVFADVRMPIMDGMELSEEILKKFSTKIFLLTSYREFDYIKRGLQIGITDYIIKNELTEESLRQLLEKTKQDILVEKKEQHMILEHNVRNFLLSNTNELEDRIYEQRTFQRYGLIYVWNTPRITLKHASHNTRTPLDCFELQNLSYPNGLTCTAFTEITSGEYCGIFFIQSDVMDSQQLLMQGIHLLYDTISQKSTDYHCLMSETCLHFFELQESFQRLKHLSEYLYTMPQQHIFAENALKNKERKPVSLDITLEKINSLLENEQYDEAHLCLEQLFITLHDNVNIWEYLKAIQSIHSFLKSYLIRKHINIVIADISTEHKTVSDLENILLDCLTSIINKQNDNKDNVYSSHVKQAIHYIQNHYTQNISIPDIAAAVNISEVHLRRLFKQELNIKVVDYITDYRIECAKLLMKNKEYSMNDIWEKTGFTSAQYFSYVFKKKEGMLPREYAKHLK